MKLNEWKVCKLVEICDLISRGVTPSYTEKHGITVINQKCIRNNRINLRLARLTNPIKKKISQEKYLKADDILINSTGVGTLGRVSYLKNVRKKMTCDSHVTIVRPNKTVHPQYLAYNLILQQPNIVNLAIGSTGQTELSRTRLGEEINVALPSLEQQERIARTLYALDEKLEINNKINQNLEEMAQAIFKHWFVDFEFPNEEGKPYKSSGGEFIDTELGSIPLNWSLQTLDDVSILSAGGDKPKTVSMVRTSENLIPIYSNGINNKGLYGYTNKAKILEESVTVSARGTIGYVCLREEPYVPIVRLVSVVPNTKLLSGKYLYQWLRCIHIGGTGTTQQQLTVPAFKKTKIIIPSIEIMQKFTSIVKPFYSQMTKNSCKNDLLVQIRGTLLPKLMSGEIRVPIDNHYTN